MPGQTDVGIAPDMAHGKLAVSTSGGPRKAAMKNPPARSSKFGGIDTVEVKPASSTVSDDEAPAEGSTRLSVKMAKVESGVFDPLADNTPPPSSAVKMFVFRKGLEPPSIDASRSSRGSTRVVEHIEDCYGSEYTGDGDETAVDDDPVEVSIIHGKNPANLRQMVHSLAEFLRPTTAKIAPKRPKVMPNDPNIGSTSMELDGMQYQPRPRRSGAQVVREPKRAPDVPVPEEGSPKSPGRAPFGHDMPPSLPKGAGEDKGAEDTAEESTSDSSSPQAVAVARPNAEVDLEKGESSGTMAKGKVKAEAAVTVTGRRIPDVQVDDGESSIILPCAPSDREKVLYYKSGRILLISCGLIAFYTMSVGMWLFTVTSPYFFWFGAPTVFLMFYLICHYLLVALWGLDFKPAAHAEILRKAEEENYYPTVDVFLPVCKEPLLLLSNTWRYVAALDYPRVTVHVLDDGHQDDVRDLAAHFGFEYVRRPDRPLLKKAGNLRYSFSRTSGEIIAIFDADFCPRADYLRETVPYLLDPSIGILQTPQFFRWRREQTWIEQGAGVTQEFFYRMVQVNQDRFNAAVCCGSCGVYRRAALQPFGGMAAIAHSEDMYTGFKITTIGYKIKYLPLNLAMGICPDEPQSFFMQQYRWCMGSATLVAERDFWTSNIPPLHKVCFMNGLLYYVASAMLIFLAPVPILLLIALEADGVLWYHSAFVVPAILLAGIIVPCWAKQRYDFASHRVKIIQCYAHLFALYDRLMGRSAPWVPSGGGASRASSKTYRSAVWLMILWNVLITVLIVGGSAWRMTYLTWYHFLPAVALAMGSFLLNMSTLWY